MLNTQTQLVHAKEVVTTGVCLVPAHEYQKPNLDILRAIVESRGADFLAFCTALGLRIQV